MLVPIVLASDKNYVPYMVTTMQSVMENSNRNQEYIFIVLYKGLHEEILGK
jgi:lipopolysaccharide biosynthesis glycosyltransferase